MKPTTSTVTLLVTTLAVLALAACGSGAGGKLSVSTRATTASAGPSAGAAALALENGITISKIRLVVRKISLERETGCADRAGPTAALVLAPLSTGSSRGMDDPGETPDDEGSSGEGCEVEARSGPAYVEIAGDALGGPVTWAFDAPVAEGTYDELAILIDTVPEGKATSEGLRAMAAAHASIVVNGTLDAGTDHARDFEFSTPMAVTQHRDGPLTIGPDTKVTLDFDPSGWFGPSGARLDPTDPTNQGAILANIRASLRILHDEDADGHEDVEGSSGR